MVGMAVALAKDLRSDPAVLRRAYATEAVEQAVVDGITRHGEDFQLAVEPTGLDPNRVQRLPVVERVPDRDDVPAGRPQDPRA